MKLTNLFKKIFCIILTIAIIVPLCSCDFSIDDAKEKGKEIWDDIKEKGADVLSGAEDIFEKAKDKVVELYGTSKDGVIWAYDKAADWTVEEYNKASVKATEIIGDAKEYIEGLNKPETYVEKYAKIDPTHLVKDLGTNVTFNEKDAIKSDNNYLTEQFITYYISSVLGARGYTVYNGCAYYKDNIYPGLIFTKNETFIEEDGKKICSCGFIQLVSNNYSGIKITDKMVQSGLIAVSTSSYGTEPKSFIVDQYAMIDDFSGIYNNVYFKYKQLDHYVLSVELKENKQSNYDSKVELYDFDNNKVIYSIEDASREVKELYVNNPECFEGATTAVNSIVDVENNSKGDLSTVLVLDGATLDKVVQTSSNGTSKVTDFIKGSLKKNIFSNISIKNNQFLSIDKDGNAHVLGSENVADETRVTNGLISSIGSGLATAGAVASIVVCCEGGAVVVAAIVVTTGVSSIVYNVSNMLSGIQDVYYGAKGDITESKNPVLEAFKKLIPDEKTATLIYHIWGVANTVVTTIGVPVTKALNIAKVKCLNAFQTAGSVIRACVTTVAKALATGIGAGIVSNYVTKVVSKVSNNGNLGKLVGFGAGLVSGMLIYKGLDSIDRKLDISGLYPKADVAQSFAKTREEMIRELYETEDISTYSRGEHKEMVGEMVERAAEFYGLDDAPHYELIYDPNWESSGCYIDEYDTLFVNMASEDNMTWNGLADTVGHETRHAWQWNDVRNNPHSEYDYSLHNYISVKDQSAYATIEEYYAAYDAYYNQPCEADAWEHGRIFAEYFLGLLG